MTTLSTRLALPPEVVGLAAHGWRLAAAYGAVALALLLPLALVELPLLADLPNHLARAFVIGAIDHDPLLARYYQVGFAVIPNLAFDLAVPALAKLMPLTLAARLFVALVVLVTLAGVACLQRTLFGRWSAWPLVAAFGLLHTPLMAGLVNFSLGVGLLLLAVAAWVRLRPRQPGQALALGTALALLLFFCHLVALAAYGLIILGYELQRAHAARAPGRAWLPAFGRQLVAGGGWRAALPFLPPLGLFVWATPGSDQPAAVVYGAWQWKAKALLGPLGQHAPMLDAASAALLGGLAVLGLHRRYLVLKPDLQPALALLALAFVLAPKGLLGGGLFDLRFVTVLALLLVAASDLRLPDARAGWLLALGLAALFGVRQAVLLEAWLGQQQDLAELRAAVAPIEPGRRVLAAFAQAPPHGGPRRHYFFYNGPQLGNLAALAVIEKSALVSALYAVPGQQPLRLTPAFRHLLAAEPTGLPDFAQLQAALVQAGQPAVPANLDHWWRQFDYLLVLYADQGAPPSSLPLDRLVDGQLVDLYAIGRIGAQAAGQAPRGAPIAGPGRTPSGLARRQH